MLPEHLENADATNRKRNDFKEIFDPCLKEIENLMRNQLVSARDAGFKVQVRKVIGNAPLTLLTRNRKLSLLEDFQRPTAFEAT